MLLNINLLSINIILSQNAFVAMSIVMILIATIILKAVAFYDMEDILSSQHESNASQSSPDPLQSIMEHNSFDREKKFAECCETEMALDPVEGNLERFTTKGALQCWLYCKYNFKCTVLLFDIFTSTCSLFNSAVKYNPYLGKKLTFIVTKFCMEREKRTSSGASIPEIVSLSQSGAGFFIQQSLPEIACLAKRKYRNNQPEGGSGFRLTWKSCTEDSRWVVKEVLQEVEQEIGHKMSNLEEPDHYYQISPADFLGLCLDVQVLDNGMAMAILSKCRTILPNKEDPQVMFGVHERSINAASDKDMHSIFSKSWAENESKYILFTSKEHYQGKSLLGVTFRDPATFQQDGGPCPLSLFVTPHSAVTSQEKVPFYLPGHQVEIRCNHGYRLPHLNHTTVQTVVCSQNTKPTPCRRIISKKRACRDQDEYLWYLVVAMVSLVIVIMLLVAIVRENGQQKETEDAEVGEVEEAEEAKDTSLH